MHCPRTWFSILSAGVSLMSRIMVHGSRLVWNRSGLGVEAWQAPSGIFPGMFGIFKVLRVLRLLMLDVWYLFVGFWTGLLNSTSTLGLHINQAFGL